MPFNSDGSMVRIAEALEDLWKADPSTHAAELAYHFAESATVTGSDRLVRYSLIAAEKALSAYAWEEAQAQFERALAVKRWRRLWGTG